MGGIVHRGAAWFGGLLAEDVLEVSTDATALDRSGWWAVVITFEGRLTAWRFDRVRPAPLPTHSPENGALNGVAPASNGALGTGWDSWPGIDAEAWSSSLDRGGYLAGVAEIRRRIREGGVYQVNLCRVMSVPVPSGADPWTLAARLARGNPAPYAGVIDVPALPGVPGTTLVSASPELCLARNGDLVRSGPIKGTASTPAQLLPKDEAENVMIVDLVRNDLQRVCRPGTVEVPQLLALEPHPGLVHLVSHVQGRLRRGAGWPELLTATMPPGSVSGAPKGSALRAITDLETTPRGPYCGAVGWVDAEHGRACLAVGIRTFWWEADRLCFGTGAGITWGSDAEQEWAETELKAHRLVGLTGDGRVEAARVGSGGAGTAGGLGDRSGGSRGGVG